MALELALVIRGDQAGAKKALEDTAAGIDQLGRKAQGAAAPARDVADALEETAEQAPKAATGVGQLANEVQRAGGGFSALAAGAMGAIAGVTAALASAVLDAGLKFAMGAVTDYFDEVTNSAKNIADDLGRHKDLIADIKGLWDQAEGAASNYGLVSPAGLTFESQQNIARLDEDLEASFGRIDRGMIRRAIGRTLEDGAFVDGPLNAPLEGLLADLEDGKADIIRWREEVVTILGQLPTDSPFREWGEQFLASTAEAAEVQAELQRAVDLFKGLTGDAAAAATAMGSAGESAAATGTAFDGALPAMREYEALLRSIGQGSVNPIEAGTTGGTYFTGGRFATGGFTGHAPTDQVAGVVHGQEYVFDAAATARIGVGNLEAIRRGVSGYAAGGVSGYAAGGVVASAYRGGYSSLGRGTGIVDIVGSLGESFMSLRGSLGGLIRELVEAGNPLQDLGASARTAGDWLLEFGARAASTLADQAFSAASAGIFDLIFGSITGGLFGSGGGRPGMGPIAGMLPRYADGTSSHPGGWALVGERGRELVNLPGGSAVYPSGATERMLGGGNLQVTYHIDARGATEGVAEQIVRALEANNRALPAILADHYRRAAL